MAPWDAIGNIGETIGGLGTNIDVPSLFGYGGGGGPAPYTGYSPQPWEYSQGSSVLPNAGYGAAAKQYGQNYGILTGTINAQPATIQNQMERQSAGIGMMGALANQTQETGYLNQDFGFGTRRLDVEQGTLNRQAPLLSGLHDLALGGMNAQAAQQRRALESAATGRGAFTSIGAQQGRADISGELARQTQGENLRYGENVAKLDDAAKNMGISRDQLQSDLQRGLERLNLTTSTSVADLMNRINSSNLQDAAIGTKIWNDALQSSDYYSRFYQGPNATAGTYGPEGSGTEKTYGGVR